MKQAQAARQPKYRMIPVVYHYPKGRKPVHRVATPQDVARAKREAGRASSRFFVVSVRSTRLEAVLS